MEKIPFTKEMAQEYTILVPDMAHIHFQMLSRILNHNGYRVEVLYNQGRSVVDEGLKYVHNDTCYPALLVIGQMLDALKSGKYDVNKTALLLTQTGGGCRASNYIPLLRKALINAGYPQIPVLSLNYSGLEKDSGVSLTMKTLWQILAALVYGDLLMLLDNQVKPYEMVRGESAALVQTWIARLSEELVSGRAVGKRDRLQNFDLIVRDFARIKRTAQTKIKVGIVGEIYVKYAALGNNNLEQFLYEQGCEVMLPGLLGFVLYCVENWIETIRLYGGSAVKKRIYMAVRNYIASMEADMLDAVRASGAFVTPSPFAELCKKGDGIIGHGCQMGEGWLLTSEMAELIELGYGNIICAQPFGCLPNHIVGKGMIRKLKERFPTSNIVPIDYDPGATSVNQENRIKLMLAVAGEEAAKPPKTQTAPQEVPV